MNDMEIEEIKNQLEAQQAEQAPPPGQEGAPGAPGAAGPPPEGGAPQPEPGE